MNDGLDEVRAALEAATAERDQLADAERLRVTTALAPLEAALAARRSAIARLTRDLAAREAAVDDRAVDALAQQARLSRASRGSLFSFLAGPEARWAGRSLLMLCFASSAVLWPDLSPRALVAVMAALPLGALAAWRAGSRRHG